jgi:hypothetical protein
MDGRWDVDRPAKGLVIGTVEGVGWGHGNFDRQPVLFFGGCVPKFSLLENFWHTRHNLRETRFEIYETRYWWQWEFVLWAWSRLAWWFPHDLIFHPKGRSNRFLGKLFCLTDYTASHKMKTFSNELAGLAVFFWLVLNFGKKCWKISLRGKE